MLCAAGLTVATHWPELQLGTEDNPAPDKLLHMFSFGLMAVLLWKTQWLKTPWQVTCVVIVWAATDEITQSIPILGRTFSLGDMAAGQLGAALVGAWLWAMLPMGGPANRARLGYQSFIVADVLARLGNLALIALCAVVGGIVIAAVTWLILRAGGAIWFVLEAAGGEPGYLLGALAVAAFVGAVGGAHVTAAALTNRRARTLGEQRPCLACGSSCRDAPADEQGMGRCPTCGEPFHRGQWVAPMDLPMSAVMRGRGRAALLAGGLLVLLVLLYAAVVALSVPVPAARLLMSWWQRQPPDMRITLDVFAVGMVLALATRVYRAKQAEINDEQDVYCRACRHDLKGTEVNRGVGRCGECGMPFVKWKFDDS